jgi:probable phosphoglycerate mutase
VSELTPPIYFVRHGVTDWNQERRIQGQTDTVLNATGHNQSEALARALEGLLKRGKELQFFVSPLTRARQTMSYIAQSFAVEDDRIGIEPRLQELRFGIWEGRLVKELKTHPGYPRDPGQRYHWRPENGESYADGMQRVSQWVGRLDRPTVIVSHGAIGRCIVGLSTGLKFEQLVLTAMPQGQFCRLINGRMDRFDENGSPA